MPRPSQYITVSEDDIISLQNLTTGLDKNLSLRAHIILESIHNSSAKAVAQTLGIDQRSVALWKKRYLESGVPGLKKTYGGGPQSPAEAPSLSKLLDRINTQESWTVSSLAKEFNTTNYMISKVLKQADVDLNRIHLWKCKTADNTSQKAFDVLALYLAQDEQAIVLSSYPLTHNVPQKNRMYSNGGMLLTRNRLLASEIKQSASEVSLADAVVAAANHSQDISHAKRTNLSSFLELTISEVPQDTEIEYHIFAHAESQPTYRGLASASIRYSNVETKEAWVRLASSWMESLSENNIPQDVPALLITVQDYLKRCKPSTEPFCWKKEKRCMQEITVLDEKDRIQQSAERLLDQMKDGDSKPRIGAVVFVQDGQGFSTQEVVGKDALPSAEEWDFSSPEAIGRVLGKAERAIDSFTRELSLKLEQQYAEEVKKNEAQ